MGRQGWPFFISGINVDVNAHAAVCLGVSQLLTGDRQGTFNPHELMGGFFDFEQQFADIGTFDPVELWL